jgi:OmpA-OmpF porin, OOP family
VTATRLAALCALAAALGGCAGSRMRTRVATVDRVIDAARENGAQTCAPVELALAEAHLDFASLELDEGDYYRARQEIAVAERNAHEALRKSPRGRCTAVAAGPGDQDGDGIPDDRDECPTEPEDFDGFEDEDGCPDLDNDNDGIPDAVDQCPNDPEDRDGFEDEDGCPDPDNDGDGLADSIDQCPDEPEDVDGFQDEDGCPDPDNDNDGIPDTSDRCPDVPGVPPDGCPPTYKNVVVTDTHIELKQTIFFDTGRATIKRVSYPLLDEVARALADRPSIKVRIEGHTDSQGKDAYNLRLSRSRAASVRDYLIGRGIDHSRMNSEGYGKARPIADNRTAAGRAQNRRVEFVITDR